MDLPPELQKTIDDLTADLNTTRLPVHIAAATLPIPKEIQHELHHWHEQLPLSWELSGHPRPEFFVSLTSDLNRLTWHTVGESPDFYYEFLNYLGDYPLDEENLKDLDEVITAAKPTQLGVWISAQNESFELGWYCAPEDELFERALPLLPKSDALEQIAAWAKKYEVTRCPRLGRSLVTQDQLTELFLVVDAETPRRSLEIGLILFRYLGFEYPSDGVLSALFFEEPSEVLVSVWFGLAGIAKIGLMLAQPSTGQFLRLNEAVGMDQEAGIALFEACLGADQVDYLEYQRTANGEGVELHYVLK